MIINKFENMEKLIEINKSMHMNMFMNMEKFNEINKSPCIQTSL